MPPAGFEIIAPVMMALRDEIASLKAEISEKRTATQHDVHSFEHVVTIKQDVDYIKKLIHELRKKKSDDLFAAIASGPASTRANGRGHIPKGISSVRQPNNGTASRHPSQGHNKPVQTPASAASLFHRL